MKTWHMAWWCAALALWTVLGSAPAQAGEMLEQTGRGVVESKKKIKPKDRVDVRQDAIRAAQRNAVWEAIVRILNDEVANARKADIESKVLVKAAAFVKESKVADERAEDRSYEVILEATVDKDALSKTLESIGIRADLVSERYSVAVIVEEYMQGEEAAARKPASRGKPASEPEPIPEIPVEFLIVAGLASEETSAAPPDPGPDPFDKLVEDHFVETDQKRTKLNDPYSGGALGAQLQKRDVRMIESSTVREMQRDLASGGTVIETLADATRLGESATAFGQRYGADAIIVGATIVSDAPNDDEGALATASLAARVVDAATGDVLAVTSRTQFGRGADAASARSNAARRVGEIVGDEFGKGLIDYWNTRNERGWELMIRVTGGATSQTGYAIARVLQGVSGVTSAENRFAGDGVVELVVTTKSSPRKLRPAMAAALEADDATSALAETAAAGGVWNFELR